MKQARLRIQELEIREKVLQRELYLAKAKILEMELRSLGVGI